MSVTILSNERDVQMLLRFSSRSSSTIRLPCSSDQVLTPPIPIIPRTHSHGLLIKSKAVLTPTDSSFGAPRRPIPQTSFIGVKANALRIFSSESMTQTPRYPLYFFAKWLATLARVFVSAIPMLTGMPVQRRILVTKAEHIPGIRSCATPSISIYASSIE